MDTGEEMNVRLNQAKFMNHFANRVPRHVAMEACAPISSSRDAMRKSLGLT